MSRKPLHMLNDGADLLREAIELLEAASMAATAITDSRQAEAMATLVGKISDIAGSALSNLDDVAEAVRLQDGEAA